MLFSYLFSLSISFVSRTNGHKTWLSQESLNNGWWFMVLNATFNNISVISWWSVLLVEKTEVPGENHLSAASHWQTLSHNVVLSTSFLSRVRTRNVSGDRLYIYTIKVRPCLVIKLTTTIWIIILTLVLILKKWTNQKTVLIKYIVLIRFFIANMRYKLFHNLSWLPNDCAIDLKLLTSGNPILSNEQNKIIFKHVFEYIKRSERFLV